MTQNLDDFIRVRIDQRHREKLNRLTELTGYTPSQLMRQILDAAEFQGTPVVTAQLTRNSDTTRQGNRVAVAS